MIPRINRFFQGLSYLLWGLWVVFEVNVLRRKRPFLGGLVVNDRCNLGCEHCRVSNRNVPDLSLDEIREGLRQFKAMGIRLLAITGGEPYLWCDGDLRLDDVIETARGMGFKAISLYTNGTLPLESAADTLFVSLDGTRETTNKLRGNVYDTVMANIERSTHPNLFINYTINRSNRDELEAFCDQMSRISQVRGVFFYFHTPYYGVDDLLLSLEEKRPLIDELLRLKTRYNVLNSSACLKAVRADAWKRPTDVCYVYAEKKMFQCCRAIGNEEACRNCGYLGYPEIISLLEARPSAIREALQYMPRRVR